MQDDLEVLNLLITPSDMNGRQAAATALRAGATYVTCRVSGFLTNMYVSLLIFYICSFVSRGEDAKVIMVTKNIWRLSITTVSFFSMQDC